MVSNVVFGAVALVAVLVGIDQCTNWLRGTACHPGFYSPHNYLATKTPYMHSGNVDPHHNPGECEAQQIWTVVRHGTRNPSAKVIKKMLNLLPPIRDEIIKAHNNRKGELCLSELKILAVWNPPPTLTEDDEKKLVEQGEEELKGIGSRFRDRFPNIYNSEYKNSTYKFKFTKTSRAEASCKSYVEAIFGKDEASKVWYPEAEHADPILRFYKGCQRWKKHIDKNPATYSEREKFEKSDTFLSLLSKIRKRTGLDSSISVETVETIYMTCSFETAWNPSKVSPWCHLFDKDDFEIMQYRQDIEYYWVDGYAYELTYKQACPAIKDLFTHLHWKAEEPESSPSLIAYFTHSGTLLKLIARFGLFNDSIPLLHNNYHLHAKRKWRTSEIDRFATNIAVVLYKCSDDLKVGLLFNELIIPIPGCTSEGNLCPLPKFISLYESIVFDCDMNQMCQL